MNPRVPRRINTTLTLRIIALAICGYFTLFFLYAVFANYWPGPFVDYWIDIPNVEKFFQGQLTFHDLVSAHANVHRLLIPRLLFIADYRFFAGSNVLLIWVSLLCKITTLLLFNHIIRAQSLNTKLLLNMLVFAAILNAANLSNVLHNSNMQWDLASAFACLAIYFHSRDFSSTGNRRLLSMSLAWLFFIGGFFSQAGTLPVLFVFVFMSLLNKRWAESVFNLLMMALVFYLTFMVLPVNEPEKPTYESAAAMMIFKLEYVAIYIFKMLSGSIYPLDSTWFVFSWIMLVLFVLSLAFSHKTRAVYNNVFLGITLFAFLMMLTIAAARVDFAPNTWAANRYQTNVMVFILALSLHAYFAIEVLFTRHKKILQQAFFIISFGSFIITQYFLHNYAFIFGNKVFDAQAYMLTHGVNQYNGASLLPSLQEFDRIASADPLFRQQGFAWYTNKQAGNGYYRQSKRIGETLWVAENKTAFVDSCAHNTGVIKYNAVEGGQGFGFSAALDTAFHSLLSAVFSRNTYYILDHSGAVIGFAYRFINPDALFSEAAITGYVATQSASYIAEISNAGLPVCLYSLDPHNNTSP